MSSEAKQRMEAKRAADHEQALKEWHELTKGDWPEEEHQQRFEAMLRVVLTAKVRK